MSEPRVVERIFAPAGKLGPSAQQWVEDGSPAELRRRGGIFDRMWRLQADSLAESMQMDAAD